VRLNASFLAAMAGLPAEGHGSAGDNIVIGSEILEYGPDRSALGRNQRGQAFILPSTSGGMPRVQVGPAVKRGRRTWMCGMASAALGSEEGR
jgi:hypothetical protein